VLEVVPKGGSVAVLGLSYKPDSNVIEEAPGFLLARNLAESGATVTVHDPMAMESVKKVLGDRVQYAKTVEEAIDANDVVVITNPDRAYAAIDLASVPRSTIVIDAWRLLRKQAEAGRFTNYVGLGLGDDIQRLSGALAGMWNDTARTPA